MPGINHVLLVGRLTRDPELMKTKSGISFCRFSVAIDRPKKKDEDSPGSDFPGCVAWRQQADFITSYGSKGCMVSVEGNIQTGSYTDRDGKKVYTTDILANRIQILESKKPKAEYPNAGKSMRRDDFDANDGFDVGMDGAPIDPNDDLPF